MSFFMFYFFNQIYQYLSLVMEKTKLFETMNQLMQLLNKIIYIFKANRPTYKVLLKHNLI